MSAVFVVFYRQKNDANNDSLTPSLGENLYQPLSNSIIELWNQSR